MNDLAQVNLNDSEFEQIRKLVFDSTGISLAQSKQALVRRRFTPRLKELGLTNFTSYIKHVREHPDTELTNFCNAITTNLTSFFRENHHYEYLKDHVLPAIVKAKFLDGRTIRVWSAGCSTGQEAYCLAMVLRSSIAAVDKWDIKVLASDIDEKCLRTAKTGIYTPEGQERAQSPLVSRYFTEVPDHPTTRGQVAIEAKDELKKMITFNRLNLINQDWPMRGKFDVIFCRNVFIYFDKATQLAMVKRYATLQNPGAYLFLGHSESIVDPHSVGYKLVGKTTYVRE